jgi:hypothetical protein
VKEHLKTRLMTEIEEMKAAVARDKTVEPESWPILAQGWDTLVAKNTPLYGLANVAGDPAQPADPASLKGGTGSDISFKPSETLDLGAEEGRGRAYRKRAALGAYGHFLEFDHILDRALGNRAAALPLVTPDQAADLTNRLAAERPVTAADQAIIDGLRARKLMKGRKMLSYDENAAWTVPLYVPHAKKVTGVVNGLPAPDVEALPASVWATVAPGLVEHVKAGNPKDEARLTAARNAMVAPVRKALVKWTDVHGSEVNKTYQNDRDAVVKANPGREAEAKAKIESILGALKVSLEAAKKEAESYF